MTYARIASAARAYDRDVQQFTGIASPIRDYEAILELTYLAQIGPGVIFQPLIQYVMHPGGGAAHPNDPAHIRRLRDAAVFGVRTTLSY